MEETQQPVEATGPEVFPLDHAALSLVRELDAQAQAINASLDGALTLFARQNNLQGRWGLAPNRKGLIKVGQ